ncbi:MAG: BA14K family protein [Pseudomonadota bacterium]|nr:BA14K family protein [Pseudomonadota bacterium]MDQ2705540.1 BA14K family protein [Pseudomonadota bacterium]
MNRFFKTAILSTAVAAMTLAAFPAANAGDRHWRRHHHHHHHNSGGGDLAVAGILGLAAGALAVGIASQPRPVYDYSYRRPVRVYRQRAYVEDYAGGLEPWTAAWYDYCSDRYRSFDARSGTFMGYDGQEHFCVAN